MAETAATVPERDAHADLAVCYRATDAPWSVGALDSRTIYANFRADPTSLIGVMDRPFDAALVVMAREALIFWIGRDFQNARDFMNFGRRCHEEVQGLEARIRALEEALAPFAAVGDLADQIGFAHEMNVASMPSDTAPLVGECIQARDVLREGKNNG